LGQEKKRVYALAKEIPDLSVNMARYMVALSRATNREVAEFSDSCLIAGQIAMKAAKENPLSIMQAIEVLQHNQQLILKGMMSAQEKMLGFVFDQVEEALKAMLNTAFNKEGETLSGFMAREADIIIRRQLQRADRENQRRVRLPLRFAELQADT
jgi:hypothetical protein